MLVLLDLSAAFDTIDHGNLFCNHIFSIRTQRVQIDNVFSYFAIIICSVPQCSGLGPYTYNSYA